MGRPSTIDRLPAELREKIGRLRDAGHTLDEIMQALEGVAVSRSAMGRHLKARDALGERLQASRQIAESLTARFGTAQPGRMQNLNIELLHSAIMKLWLNAGGQDGGEPHFDPKDLMMLASALANTARASKTDAEYREQMESLVRQKLEEEMAQKLDAVAQDKSQGLSPHTIQAIRQRLLGTET
ncbi:DUF3486 family protein [Formicincola oecophyllae]|uniref:DUF3486 family protein n=1 Tax=Formicincola oecophyllae TaxID=2558361 RepID=UPI00143D510B|nr:DUF3486 family protein [Formicincola oecophyllae]